MTQTTASTIAFAVHRSSVQEVLGAIALLKHLAIFKLKFVRDRHLYQEKYSSFEEYCNTELQEWGGYQTASALLDSSTPCTEVSGGV
ncbi:hypothetical protein ACX27_27415 [Nostoc piscinale CENA21]|uniref:Uncharacterized protein n=1 Tax=Nostoc piscinale CENA21 TaxID=224013 RepID=A0A0M3V6N2_9NOSO|nr:hypothetical protein [Nostoc piscinale]ALF55737.1 hypothetical protein ACX27_27415 [Nostoc piscinale CENA21]